MLRRTAFALAVALVAPPALAYNEALHALLTQRALAAGDAAMADAAAPLAPPTDADLAALRALFWKAGAELPDAALRAKWLQRFPTAGALDAWSFKELLMLNPEASVHGFDAIAADAARPRAALQSDAARWPDDDERNRRRYFHDAQRKVVLARDGTPMPDDPITLQLGSLSGTTSQGHAHYGLLHSGYSDDPEVLKKDPRHFAIPPTIRAFGCDFAQLYSDLALVAGASGLPSAAWLREAFAGAAFHHVEDVANQIHTVQVGVYAFFESAFLQSKLRDLQTAGGLLGARWSLRLVGLRLVANHHLFLEDLFARRVGEAASGKAGPAAVSAALAGLGQDDAAFASIATAAVAPAQAQPGRALCDALVEVSSFEGPEAYQLSWEVSSAPLHSYRGHEYSSPPDDPDQWLGAPSPKRDAALEQFWTVEARGLSRAATSVRALEGRLRRDAAQPAPALVTAAIQRILRFALPYQDEAAARRASYAPAGPDEQGVAWGYPVGYAVLLALAALGIRKALS